LYGNVNAHVEILFLASKGALTLDHGADGAFCVTAVDTTSSDCGVGKKLQESLLGAQALTGTDLQRKLYHSDLNTETADFLVEQGYFKWWCGSMLWRALAIIAPPLFPLVELGNAYQTILQPLFFSLGMALIEICGTFYLWCTDGQYVLRLPSIWARGLVACVVLPLLVMGLYWDRPVAWDTVEMVLLAALTVALWVWGILKSTRWTYQGARTAVAIIRSRRSVLDAPPAENAEPKEMWRYAAYVSALGVPMVVGSTATNDWVAWARESVADPDAPVGGGWDGGGGDFGGGGGFGGGGDCGGGGGGGGDW
jgi:hypothetical protein